MARKGRALTRSRKHGQLCVLSLVVVRMITEIHGLEHLRVGFDSLYRTKPVGTSSSPPVRPVRLAGRIGCPFSCLAVKLRAAMTGPNAPLLIAYDGSETAKHAIREAGRLFGSREVLVVTVWEPGARVRELDADGRPGDAARPGRRRGGARGRGGAPPTTPAEQRRSGADLAQSVGLEAKGSRSPTRSTWRTRSCRRRASGRCRRSSSARAG